MNVINKKKHRRSRSFGMSFLLGALFCAFLTMTGQAFSQIPRGVFCLLPVGAGAGQDPLVYHNADVDGISARQNWSDLEPTENVYDWTYLDKVTAKAAAAGKPVLLRISTQANKPAWVTAAVTDAGGTFFTFDGKDGQTTIPVFWDPTYLAKKTAMIAALGAHFTNNPAVKIVGASFANAQSEDWAVPHSPADVTAWFAAGYTSDKMLAAGKQIIDATMAAFPNQYVTLSVGTNGHTGSGPNLDPTANYVANHAVLDARASWPGRLIVQKNTLTTFTPAAPGTGTVWAFLWNSGPDIAGQMFYWCFGDTTYRVNGGVPADPAIVLRNSIDIGLGYGMKYIEIYRTDVLNLPAVITYAHGALTAP
jgi:Beta-galactosidase